MAKQDELIIKAQKRTVTGKKVNALRRKGFLPAVVYGHKIDPIAIQLDAHSAGIQLSKITGSSLITLDIDGKKHQVIMRDRQRDVIYGSLLHVDFLAVSMTEKLITTVGIELVGEAPVLKTGDVMLNHALNTIEIESLPQDMIARLEVDVSGLESMEDVITVGDLQLGDKVTVLTDPEEVIVSVTYAAIETAAEEEAEEVEGGHPEVIEQGKKEDEGAE